MIDELRALAIFAKTVESHSFRTAAKELKLSPSVVSHHISQLEERLGVTLLYRSTRHLSLTPEGENLFIAAKQMVQAAENGLNKITHKSPEPSGKLSITIPAVLSKSPLMNALANFAKTFPKIALSIGISDVKQDLIRQGIDLAIRIGELKDSALKAKRLFVMPRKLIVAPDYMIKHKAPHKPQDLAGWDWIGLQMRANHKTLINKAGKNVQIHFQPRIIVDSVETVSTLAIAGLGLATPPSFLVENEIKKGLLVELVPLWGVESLGVYAVWPPNSSKKSLAFRLIDFLEKSEKIL